MLIKALYDLSIILPAGYSNQTDDTKNRVSMFAICSTKSLTSLVATLRLSPIAFCHGMLFVKHFAHRVDCGSLRSIPGTIGMNHARNIRHDDSPFFQPDMFIAGTHLHRQGT